MNTNRKDPPNAADLRLVRRALGEMAAIPAGQWRIFRTLLESRELTRGEYFVRVGEPATEFAVVIRGALREFYSRPNGTEFNKSFCMPGEFSGSYYDLLSGSASTASIEAMSNCRLIVGDFEKFTELYALDPVWERIGRLLAERLFVRKARREYEFQALNAEERYRLLKDRTPQLEDLIPQFHIASYLGITPVALSRIRQRIRDRNQGDCGPKKIATN